MDFLWFSWTVGVISMSGGEVAPEIHVYQPGDSAIVECEISYHSETSWLRQRALRIPEVLLQAYLLDGRVSYRHRPFARFQAEMKGRSFALRVGAVEAADAGLYYCLGLENKITRVGRGTRLEVVESLVVVLANHTTGKDHPSSTEAPGAARLSYAHLHAAAVGLGVLGMTLAVVVTHLRTRTTEAMV